MSNSILSIQKCNHDQNDKYIVKIFNVTIKITLNYKNIVAKIFKFSSPIIKLLDKILPKDKTKAIFTSYPDFSDGAYLFYEYLIKNQPNLFKNFIWLKDECNSEKLTIKDKKYFVYSILGLYHLLTAKYIFHDHCNIFLDCISSSNHVLFNLWHGSPIKSIGLLDRNLLSKIKKRYVFMAKNSYWFVTSDIYKIIISSVMQIDPNRIFVTGNIRTDNIFKNTKDKLIKDYFNLGEFNKVILYAPTYKSRANQKIIDVDINYNNLFSFDENNYGEDFINYLKGNNICLIVKPHPFETKRFLKLLKDGGYDKIENIKILTTNDLELNSINLNELFRLTDLIISDFSSITIDYAITNKPILYLNQYVKNYRDGRGLILPDNYKIIMPGETVDSYIELKDKITKCLMSGIANYTEEDLTFLYKYVDGNSGDRITEVIKKIKSK